MLFEGHSATVVSFLRILSYTYIQFNHIPGEVELMLHMYQLDNHKSRHVQYTFHFERTSPCS